MQVIDSLHGLPFRYTLLRCNLDALIPLRSPHEINHLSLSKRNLIGAGYQFIYSQVIQPTLFNLTWTLLAHLLLIFTTYRLIHPLHQAPRNEYYPPVPYPIKTIWTTKALGSGDMKTPSFIKKIENLLTSPGRVNTPDNTTTVSVTGVDKVSFLS